MTNPSILPPAMAPSDPREARLVARLKAKDPLAFGEVYDRYGTLVYRVALRLVRDVCEAEDLTQETFLCLWNGIGTFEAERGTLLQWVCLIARCRAIDYLRSRQYRMRRVSGELAEGGHGWQTADRLEYSQLLEEPWKGLEGHEREVLRLAYWLGLTQAEIAERLGRPLGTIKTWMRKAHRSLRMGLEGGWVG